MTRSLHTAAPSSPAWMASQLVDTAISEGALLFAAEDNERLAAIAHLARHTANDRVEILEYPALDVLPYDTLPPSPTLVGRRIRTLDALSRASGHPLLVLTSTEALVQHAPPKSLLADSAIWFEADHCLDIGPLCVDLATRGYSTAETVQEPGEVAIRGNTIDIFPAGDPLPVRLTLSADNVISAITTYDPITQLSIAEVERVAVHRAIEFEVDADTARAAGDALEQHEHGHPKIFHVCDQHRDLVSIFDYLPDVATICDPATTDRIELFSSQIQDAYEATIKAARVTGSSLPIETPDRLFMPAKAILEILASRAIKFPDEPVNEAPLGMSEDRQQRLAHEDRSHKPLTPIVGDLVIHLDHGLAILAGLQLVENDAGAEERVVLEFADRAELLVPVTEISKIWRYGGSDIKVALDRIDGDAWRRKRQEIDAEIKETAQALFEAAEGRKKLPTWPINANHRCAKFARGFAYSLTSDQRTAIGEVAGDMQNIFPMNRLLCGDVGFGKTEVALRAIAAAAFAGYQVAIAAPTTVLARQHFETLIRRFDGSGLFIDYLQSTKSSSGKATLKKLASGDVSIVVGTHNLASKDVTFARLALVVIDEEQRFGDKIKEALTYPTVSGSDRPHPHVLTMTATPIPKTLQGALVGLRDVSALTTPPGCRQHTRSFAIGWDDVVFREAVLRERRRGGQTFVVVPRISDMAEYGQLIARLAPELAVVQVHGKMADAAVEKAILGFAAGRGDILLATNIIEAGLDIPRANTIFIVGAERFGLAQLHQMRGRVGRGNRQGYAYFIPAQTQITAKTTKRLASLERLSQLGAGAAISAADLEQRGGGDLFGERQTGHVRAIGTELYQHLLAEALSRERGVKAQALPELCVSLAGSIPETYVPEANLRFELYARSLELLDEEAIGRFENEVVDRFGPMPEATKLLMSYIRLRCQCAANNIVKLESGPKAVALTPGSKNSLTNLAKTLHGQVKSERVIVDKPNIDKNEIESLSEILNQ